MDDLISRQAAIEAIMGLPTWWADEGGYYGGAQPPMEALLDPEDAVSAIENLPSAQPEITDEQAIEHLQSTGWMQNHDREMYESGLREQLADDSGSYDSLIPCEDAISRQAVLDGIEELKRSPWYQGEGYAVRKDAVEIVEQLCVKEIPSAQPERKTGKWLPDNRPGGGFWVCSCCKFPSEAFAANVLYKFCPNCGAYMGGSEGV